MSTETMIERALNTSSLVISERAGRTIIGQMIKTNAHGVVIKVIRARGMRAGERVTVSAQEGFSSIRSLAVRELRAELASWGIFRDADEDAIMAAPASVIIDVARRQFGSWADALSVTTAW